MADQPTPPASIPPNVLQELVEKKALTAEDYEKLSPQDMNTAAAISQQKFHKPYGAVLGSNPGEAIASSGKDRLLPLEVAGAATLPLKSMAQSALHAAPTLGLAGVGDYLAQKLGLPGWAGAMLGGHVGNQMGGGGLPRVSGGGPEPSMGEPPNLMKGGEPDYPGRTFSKPPNLTQERMSFDPEEGGLAGNLQRVNQGVQVDQVNKPAPQPGVQRRQIPTLNKGTKIGESDEGADSLNILQQRMTGQKEPATVGNGAMPAPPPSPFQSPDQILQEAHPQNGVIPHANPANFSPDERGELTKFMQSPLDEYSKRASTSNGNVIPSKVGRQPLPDAWKQFAKPAEAQNADKSDDVQKAIDQFNAEDYNGKPKVSRRKVSK